MSSKRIYTCDICGKQYEKRNWTLECDTFFKEDYCENRKIVMDICKDCAKWIKKQRGKGEHND